MGIRGKVSRSTLADANSNRDWRIYADLAHALIPVARKLYLGEDFGVELDQTVYALDATTIDLCLSVFPWRNFNKPRERSNCTRCSTFAAAFQPSSISPTARSTTSTFWTTWSWKPVPSMSWIVATSTFSGSTT